MSSPGAGYIYIYAWSLEGVNILDEMVQFSPQSFDYAV